VSEESRQVRRDRRRLDEIVVRAQPERGPEVRIGGMDTADQLGPHRVDVAGRGERQRADQPPAVAEPADQGGGCRRRAEIDREEGARIRHQFMLPALRRGGRPPNGIRRPR
jgi:hypothetical protein